MYPAFFIAPATNPRQVCFCHFIVFISSEIVTPPFRCIRAMACAILLPSRGEPASRFFAAVLALGAFLAAGTFLVALAFAGASFADCAPPLAFLSGLGFFSR